MYISVVQAFTDMAGFHHTVSRIRVVYDNPDYMKPVTMLYIKFRDSIVLLFGPCVEIEAYDWDTRLSSLQTNS